MSSYPVHISREVDRRWDRRVKAMMLAAAADDRRAGCGVAAEPLPSESDDALDGPPTGSHAPALGLLWRTHRGGSVAV